MLFGTWSTIFFFIFSFFAHSSEFFLSYPFLFFKRLSGCLVNRNEIQLIDPFRRTFLVIRYLIRFLRIILCQSSENLSLNQSSLLHFPSSIRMILDVWQFPFCSRTLQIESFLTRKSCTKALPIAAHLIVGNIIRAKVFHFGCIK